MKYFIIWDIHWQYNKLIELIDKYFLLSDKVIFLWDYIDKNKDSLKTLEYIINLKKLNIDKVEILWWNHEIFMINSILFNDYKLFETWFYLNKAFETTFFDYVSWNDRILFRDWYMEFVNEYFITFIENDYLKLLSSELLKLWKIYYKDNECFCIHWWLPINVINRNEYKIISFYNWVWEKSLVNLELDYKKWDTKAITFFWETKINDPTWYDWANIYERITKEAFETLLNKLWINKMFIWHQKWLINPKYSKFNKLFTLNFWCTDIWYYYWDF